MARIARAARRRRREHPRPPVPRPLGRPGDVRVRGGRARRGQPDPRAQGLTADRLADAGGVGPDGSLTNVRSALPQRTSRVKAGRNCEVCHDPRPGSSTTTSTWPTRRSTRFAGGAMRCGAASGRSAPIARSSPATPATWPRGRTSWSTTPGRPASRTEPSGLIEGLRAQHPGRPDRPVRAGHRAELDRAGRAARDHAARRVADRANVWLPRSRPLCRPDRHRAVGPSAGAPTRPALGPPARWPVGP